MKMINERETGKLLSKLLLEMDLCRQRHNPLLNQQHFYSPPQRVPAYRALLLDKAARGTPLPGWCFYNILHRHLALPFTLL
jgi:hypothetical protein